MTRSIIAIYQGQADKKRKIGGAFTRENAIEKMRSMTYKNAKLRKRGMQLGFDCAGGFIYIEEK